MAKIENAPPRVYERMDSFAVHAFQFVRCRPWLMAFVASAVVCGIAALLSVRPSSIGYGNTLVSSGLAIALFVPGAIQVGRWTTIAVMLVLGGISPFLVDWLLTYWPNPRDWILAWVLILSIGVCCLLVASQWLITTDDSLRKLGWGLLVVVASAATFSTVGFVVMGCKWLDFGWSRVILTCLFPVVIWFVLPLAFRTLLFSGGRTKVCVAATSLLSLYACLIFFRVGVYDLGETSLMNRGPFSQTYGVQLLDHRGRQRDYDLILAALAKADWSVRWDRYAFERELDWRHTAVELLIRHDREWVAEKLADILVESPSRTLIDMTDGLFVEQKRYETAPVYLRYALLSSPTLSDLGFVGQDKYRLALEEMGVPQVVDAWLYRELVLQFASGMLRAKKKGSPYVLPATEEWIVRDEIRPRLAALLGEDAGPYYLEWFALYEERIDDVTTPLTPEQHAEANRVVKCFADYFLAWSNAPKEPKLLEPNWDCPTIEQLEAEIDRYVQKVNSTTVP